MTPQEQSMLNDLIQRVQTTNLTEKDPQAQEMLNQQLGSHPDSLYILAQTVLVQNYALQQAKQQMDQLRQQAQSQPASSNAPAKSGSFLGSLFGHHEQPAQQQSYTPPPSQQNYAPPATQWSTPQSGGAYPPPGNYPQQAPQSYPAPGGGGSSFLRSAATTAAGVAAGALAFQGVESLMHGFGREAGYGAGGFGGGGMMGGGFGAPVEEETVVNNYYDSPGGQDGSDRGDNRFDNAGYDSGNDDRSFTASDDNNLQPQLDQADDVNVTDDDSGSYDDASFDDGGGDFGGGDDSSLV